MPIGAVIVLLASCLSPPRTEIDASSGRALQQRLVNEYFGDQTGNRAGRVYTVNNRKVLRLASSDFNPEDSSGALQAAFDSEAGAVFIPKMPSPWITNPLFIRRPLVLIMEKGAVIEAKQGEYQRPGEVLLSILECSNVRIYGYGAVLRMHKQDYQNPPYKPGQWRHAIQIRGSSEVVIAGLAVESSGGDGVYLGRGKNPVTSRNITLQDLVLTDHHRQGISVITAENLLIENCTIRGTRGNPPEAGIDFEPNNADEPMINCVVKNCIISGNAGAGIQGYFVTMDSGSRAFSITIEDCVIFDQTVAVFFSGFQGAAGSLHIIDSDVRGLKFIPNIPELDVRYQ